MNFFWHLAALVCMLVPGALGYNFVFGKAKILHFGPVGVSLVASYCAYVTLSATDSYMFAILAGFTGATVISAFYAWLSLRLDGDALGILTLAVHLAVLTVVLNWTDVTGGTLGITSIPRMFGLDSPSAFALAACAVAALWIIVFLLIERSAFGRQIEALAEYGPSAASLGISRPRVYFIVFLVAGLAAACTSMLYTQYYHLLHPGDFTFAVLILYIMIVVAGKPGSVRGTIIATIFIILLREGVRFLPLAPQYVGSVRLLLFGLILFAAVWWRRKALFPQQRIV